MAKKLEDARDGLLRYWQLVPSGGTRADLILRATQQGFEEPLLNEWLDVFLQGFVDMDWIATPDYDLSLVPRFLEVGYAKAERAVNAVFVLLTRQGDTLDVVRLQNSVVALQDEIDQLNAQLTLIAQGRAWVVANAPAGGPKDEALIALDVGVVRIVAFRDSRVVERDKVQARLALLGG